jgi:hypothetical protein
VVFRSIWQGLQQWARPEGPGTETTGMSDEELKAQAIQDPQQTQSLIAIENARGAMKLKMVVAVGVLGLLALLMVLGAALTAIQAAGELKLPWRRMATVGYTFLGTSAISGLVAWRVKKRILKRRQAAAQSENPPAEDPDQVGTP